MEGEGVVEVLFLVEVVEEEVDQHSEVEEEVVVVLSLVGVEVEEDLLQMEDCLYDLLKVMKIQGPWLLQHKEVILVDHFLLGQDLVGVEQLEINNKKLAL